MYEKEINKLKNMMGHELWDLLSEQGCYIAGGALTSLFSNQEVNDIDVYFPSKEAFTHVLKVVYNEEEFRSDYDLGYADAIVQHVSRKAVLLTNAHGQKIQFIAHKFYPIGSSIFDDFDFTINMAMVYMHGDYIVCHNEFFKHLAQRYLQVNTSTSYPLISVLRVDKYRKRGYNISKSQMLRLLLAVNAKNIDSWDKLADELGGMYGTSPEEIFDYSVPFSLQLAIEKLDNFEIKENIVANSPMYEDIVSTIPWAFTDKELNRILESNETQLEKLLDYKEKGYYGWFEKEIPEVKNTIQAIKNQLNQKESQ